MADGMTRNGVCSSCYATLCARRDSMTLGSGLTYHVLVVWCPDTRCWNHEETTYALESIMVLPMAEQRALFRAADRHAEAQEQQQTIPARG